MQGGFPAEPDAALRSQPGLLEAVASRVLDTCFPQTLHGDIAAAVGLALYAPVAREPAAPAYTAADRRRRDPGFRERVLRAFFPLQQADLLPAPEFLAWNVKNVFKTPARQTPAATPPAAR